MMNNSQHTHTYPIIPPPPPHSSNRYVAVRKKAWMKKSTGKEFHDGIDGCNDVENEEAGRQKRNMDLSKEKRTTTKSFYLDSRDDQDELIEEERVRLFSHSSSLSFSIDHYCMMVGKVYISFLKLFKRHCTSPCDDNISNQDDKNQRKHAYDLGRRLQVFLKEVLPSHIHYHTDFEGRDQIINIETQLDEYMNIITLVIEEGVDECDRSGRDSVDSFSVCDDNDNDDVVDVVRENDAEHEHDEMRPIGDRSSNEVSRQSSSSISGEDDDQLEISTSSTSYSNSGHEEWDNFECAECDEDGEVGFILNNGTKHNKNEFSLLNDDKEKNDDLQSVTELPDFKFKTLVSHWRAQEKKWKQAQYR